MSRSDWRARKVNVGSQHPAHTLRDDHDCGDVPPSPLLCDDVSPVDSMVVPVLQGHCNSNADSSFKPALDSKVALHSHPVAPRVTACASPMCTASPLLSDDAPSPLLFSSHEASPHALTPHEQKMISHLYNGAPFPLLAFHSDLESVRVGRTEDSLDSGQVFAESMIVSNIISALDQPEDPALSGCGGGGGGVALLYMSGRATILASIGR